MTMLVLAIHGDECFVITFQLANSACAMFVTIGINYIIRKVRVYEIRLYFPIHRRILHQEFLIYNGLSNRTRMSIVLGNKIECFMQLCHIANKTSKIILKSTMLCLIFKYVNAIIFIMYVIIFLLFLLIGKINLIFF